jgi:DNA-binding NarL/FixJ family response regulator
MKRDCLLQRWLIADTTAMYAEGVANWIRRNRNVEIISIASSKSDLVCSLADNRHELLIIDPRYLQGDSWFTDVNCLRALRDHDCTLPIVVFTAETNPAVLHDLSRIDRVGVVSKSDELQHLLDVCDRVLSGQQGAVSPVIARMKNNFNRSDTGTN